MTNPFKAAKGRARVVVEVGEIPTPQQDRARPLFKPAKPIVTGGSPAVQEQVTTTTEYQGGMGTLDGSNPLGGMGTL